MFGATLQPYLQEYVVGPLPVTNQTKVQLLEFLFNNEGKGKIKIDNADDDTVGNFLQTVGLSVADITQTLWNGVSSQMVKLFSYEAFR